MVNYGKNVRYVCFFLAIVLGCLIGCKVYDAPVSVSMRTFRLLSIVTSCIMASVTYIGYNVIKKYNINDELVIDEEAADYFDEIRRKMASNTYVAIMIAFLLNIVLLIGEYHAPMMIYVSSIFYSIYLFIYLFPLIGQLYYIIRLVLEYKSTCNDWR